MGSEEEREARAASRRDLRGGASRPRKNPERQAGRAQSDLFAVVQLHRFVNPGAGKIRPVLALEIFELSGPFANENSGMPARDGGVIDPGDRLPISAEDVLAGHQRDLSSIPKETVAGVFRRGAGSGTRGLAGLAAEGVSVAVDGPDELLFPA